MCVVYMLKSTPPAILSLEPTMPPLTTRREFLQQSTETAVAAAGLGMLAGAFAAADETPARLNLGIIGCGGIMTHHVKGLVGRKEAVSIAWLCDVDPAQIERMAGVMDGHQSHRPNGRPDSRT